MRARLIAVAIVVPALLAGVFFYALQRDPVTIDAIPSPLASTPAPATELATFAPFQADYGARLRPLDYGKPVVLNFWASWCAPCHDEAPAFETAWLEFQEQVLFVGVNAQDRSVENAEQFIQQYQLSFPNGRDDSRLWAEYGVYAMPETFFISAEGIIVDYHRGPLTLAMLREKIARLLEAS